MDKWKEIWNKRTYSHEVTVLAGLIAADGFDLGAGRITVSAWEQYGELVAQRLAIKSTESLFEVGCGSGAFLYPFFSSGHRVGGIDYSGPLIDTARAFMTGMDFSVAEACKLSGEDKYDIVLANSVFQYFPDLDYAEAVVNAMIKKAGRAVALLEIPDLRMKAEAECARAAALLPGEYEQKYKGLTHRYYAREWFEKFSLGSTMTLNIFDQHIEHYGNSEFRYNVVLEKIR